MKKFRLGLIRAMMLTASLLFLAATRVSANQNDFNIQVRNLTQPTDRTIEFDVYLLDTDAAQQFELGSIQLGFLLNSGIYSGGTLTATISNTGSGLNALQQFTASPERSQHARRISRKNTDSACGQTHSGITAAVP